MKNIFEIRKLMLFIKGYEKLIKQKIYVSLITV